MYLHYIRTGVTLGTFVRCLKITEIEAVDFPGGFELSLAGFLQKTEGIFGC
jgi:hypothetical protein